jgi:two-component system response regulator RegX3
MTGLVPNENSVAAPRIAVLEDDPSQSSLLERWITSEGYVCHVFDRGNDIVKALLNDTFDLVVLDWEVPDLSGEQVLKLIRKSAREYIPVLFTTARSREEDMVRALKNGADDYLVKPLRRLEFLARIEALLRRFRTQARVGNEPFQIGPYRVDVAGRTLWRNGVAISLTQKEFNLAVLLLRDVGRILSRPYLLDTVWGPRASIGARTVDSHISQLRSKLDLYPERGWRLSAVYQRGYRLERIEDPDADDGESTPGPSGNA